MSKATNVYRANVVTVNPLALQIQFDPHDQMVEFNGRDRGSRIYRCFHWHNWKKKAWAGICIVVGANQLFCNIVYLRNIFRRVIHVNCSYMTIKGGANDQSVCSLYILGL